MIDKLKKVLYTLRVSEKYISGILAYEWMQHHPHFHGNDKKAMLEIRDNLIKTSEELKVIIDSMNIEINGSKQ
jgi:hypothetical protein|tara:strand:+ start:229 stop:447 length:219 start_codon:yes stop_codon:yes gene_type:complete